MAVKSGGSRKKTNKNKNSYGGKNSNSKKPVITLKQIAVRVAVLAVLAIIFGITFLFSNSIDRALGLKKQEESAFDGMSTDNVINISDGTSNPLIVHFVDVGQGDACIIELPDGKKILIDGGKDKEKTKLLTYIKEKIDTNDAMKSKKESGGYGFDYAILTHADEDHCGGFDDVLQTYAANVFYRPNELASYKNYTDPGKKDLISGFTEQSTLAYMKAIEAGYKSQAIHISGDTRPSAANTDIIEAETAKDDPSYYSLQFYTPILNSYKDRNDYSPIMILTYQSKRFVLSGDAEKAAEEEFVEAAKSKQGKFSIFDESFTADVIKLGHHGSKTSSTKAYLETLTTSASASGVLAIVSCGIDNSYKHPHIEALNRLIDLGFKQENILRTDVNSSIVLAVNNGELYYGADVVKVEKAAVSIGGAVDLTWREICITIWILLALALIIQPLIGHSKIKA